jgi:P4 family phage/plasmid primase-like protien
MSTSNNDFLITVEKKGKQGNVFAVPDKMAARLIAHHLVIEKGFNIAPVQPGCKGPTFKDWTTMGSYELRKKCQDHVGNFVILTGKRHNNLICFDLDKPRSNGFKDGVEEFKKMMKIDSIKEMETFTVKTPSGGFHLYFRCNFKVDTSAFKDLGIDILWNGKAAMSPYSTYPGCDPEGKGKAHKCQAEVGQECLFKNKRYKIYNDCDIIDVPDILREKLIVKSVPPPFIKEKTIKTKNFSNSVEKIEKLLSLTLPKDWDDITYTEWTEVIWTLLSLGMDSEDVHKWCALGEEKYQETSTDKVISCWNEDIQWGCGPKSKIMKWIRSCLYKRNMTDEQVQRALMKAIGENNSDIIEKHLFTNINFKGFVSIYYELYAQTNIVTIDTSHPFYMWSEEKKLWIHYENHKLASAKLYADFSNFMDSILRTYASLQADSRKREIVQSSIDKINGKRNYTELEGCLLPLCEDPTFIQLINNVKEDTIAYDTGKIINLRTSEIRNRIRTDYYTKSIPISPSDHDYPNITKFINSLWDGQEERIYIQKLCGYFMTGSISDRSIYIWVGDGMNGKSVLVKLLRKVLGYHAVNASRSILLDVKEHNSGPSPELMQLMNARLAILAETKHTDRLNDEQIKAIVGGDTISARALYSNVTEFQPKNKLLLMTNHKPKFDSTDVAMVDRIKLLTFPKRFENTRENTKYVEDLIENYGNEMFSYMIAGAKMFYEQGLTETTMMKADKEQYCNEENSFATFLMEKCQVSENDRIDRVTFNNAYKTYCSDNKLVVKSLKWLADHNYIKIKRFNSGLAVLGYRFKTDED